MGCPLDFYNQLSALLADPANDVLPAMAAVGQASAASHAALDATLTPLGRQVRAANKPENDPKFLNCQPYGFVREVTNPLPLQIRRDGEHLLVRYEEWSLLRPIYMDGRPQPTHSTPSLLGHSVGRVENGALIVETTRVTPDLISDSSQAGHSGELTAVERYMRARQPAPPRAHAHAHGSRDVHEAHGRHQDLALHAGRRDRAGHLFAAAR